MPCRCRIGHSNPCVSKQRKRKSAAYEERQAGAVYMAKDKAGGRAYDSHVFLCKDCSINRKIFQRRRRGV